jgi:(1->4)-alpha-D-glucan 1-alpha-D-glucosylmutase
VCAFARHADSRTVIVVVPRLTARLTGNGARLPLGPSVWADTHVLVPERIAAGVYVDAFSGAEHRSVPHEAVATLAVAELLAHFPVALLESKA